MEDHAAELSRTVTELRGQLERTEAQLRACESSGGVAGDARKLPGQPQGPFLFDAPPPGQAESAPEPADGAPPPDVPPALIRIEDAEEADAVPPPPPPPPPPVHAQRPNLRGASRALLVICYNRPDYLRRTLSSVMRNMPSYNRPHIYISQDGDDPAVTGVIQEFKDKFATQHKDITFNHLKHPPGWMTGYYKLAQHFGWALNRLFVDNGHTYVIVLEDDLEIAPDFFDYFTATEMILSTDKTLLAASAWNDIGQPEFVQDPKTLYRSDFFPGLGWMLSRHAWEELGPKWPEAFWDDWLREPPQRKDRAFIRPEVSRTYTFGKDGTSNSQFFDQYLVNIKLNDQAIDWANQDITYLYKRPYDSQFMDVVRKARKVGYDDIVQHRCSGGEDVKAYYGSFDGANSYSALARQFGFIDDVKAKVPRTAYMGVVTLHHNGCRKFLVSQQSDL